MIEWRHDIINVGVIMGFDENNYNTEWKKSKTDSIILRVPKGKKAELQALAKDEGKSLTKLIIEAVEEKYLIDLSRKKD